MKTINFEEINNSTDFLTLLSSFLENRNFSFKCSFQFIEIDISLINFSSYKEMEYYVWFYISAKDKSFEDFERRKKIDLENECIEINISYLNTYFLKTMLNLYFKNYKSWKNKEQTSFKYFGQEIIINRSPNGVYELINSNGESLLFDDIKQLVGNLILSTKEFIAKLDLIKRSKKGDFIENLYGLLKDDY